MLFSFWKCGFNGIEIQVVRARFRKESSTASMEIFMLPHDSDRVKKKVAIALYADDDGDVSFTLTPCFRRYVGYHYRYLSLIAFTFVTSLHARILSLVAALFVPCEYSPFGHSVFSLMSWKPFV